MAFDGKFMAIFYHTLVNVPFLSSHALCTHAIMITAI